jgi:SAM-dependent methyltransferase
LNRIYNSIQDKGVSRTFQSVISVLEDFYFEMKYGISTSKIVKREDLDISLESKEHSEEYKPTRIRHFRLLIRDLKLPENSVFVDMGSGKGRVLLKASLYKFKRITGVEISSRLCEIAKINISKFEKILNRRLYVEIVNEDVLKYNIKNDENIFYFYNPFDNYVMEIIIERVMKSITANPRKVWLILNNFTPFSDMIENKFKLPAIKKFIYGGTEIAIYTIN